MSLFGSTSASSPFPNLGNAATTATQQSNPFLKPAGGSLFGNTATTNNTNTQSTNPFNTNATPSIQLNGQPVSSQSQPMGSSLFNNSQQPQQQPTLGLGQQQNVTAPSNALGGLQNGLAGQGGAVAPKTTALFQNLLERGKGRQTDSRAALGELPSLKLGLSDIASRVRDIGGSTGSQNGGRSSSRAHYLLAASGVPRASTLRDLDTFNSFSDSTVLSPAPATVDTDIDAYVNTLQAKSSAELMQDYMVQTKRDFDAFVEDRFGMDQQEQRQRIYEHFGLSKPEARNDASRGPSASSGGRASFGRSSRNNASQSSPNRGPFGASQSLARSVLGMSAGRNNLRGSMFSDVSERTSTAQAVASEDPSLRSKQEKYAVKVRELNMSLLQERVYPVVEQFARVEIESGDDAPQHLIEAYRALKRITGEDSSVQSLLETGAIRQRQYAKDYLETSDSGRALEMRKRILAGSKAYVEDSFFASVENIVARNPREANLGGVPSKINKVRAYVRVRAARKDLGTDEDVLQKIDEDFCWALIFYLLRCGLVQEAAQYVAEHETPIKIMDRGFPTYMALYAGDPERRLPADSQRRINHEYQVRRVNAPEKSIDPYRMACYKIIGRCELEQKTLAGLNTGLEDWLWVVLSLARETPRTEEIAGSSFGLEDVRVLFEQIGQRHFQSSDNAGAAGGYATFFYLQILAGSFESAVSWLYQHNYIVAVHFAIALDFYGLLRVSEFDAAESRLLSQSTTQLPQISFARLLGYYTQDFRLARPAEAAEYLTLICLNTDLPGSAGAVHASVCHEALKELVLETREFALLLGDVRSDGRRIPGVIEQRLALIGADDNADFLKSLTIQAAAVADDSGRTTDAVLLYHLAEEYDSVVTVINRALSDAISVELGRDPLRLQPMKPRQNNQQQQQTQKQQQNGPQDSSSLTSVDDPAVLARNMISLYNVNAMYFQKIRQINRDACGILIRMSEARSKVETGRWAEAIDMIGSLELLPLRAKGNVSVIRSSAQAFSALPQAVSRNIGSLLIWTITCLGKQREAIRNSAFQQQRPISDELVVMAKDLMVYAGLIRYKLSPDVFETLALGAY